jgi:aryl-alcohol dehydrogenase-like predicted oxidoreductase
MEKRKVGNSGISIPPIIIGGNVFGWTVDEPTSFRLLDACADAGLVCIDTADVYSRWIEGNQGGESETIIGKWMKQRNNRSEMIIFTKLGKDMGPGKKGLSPAYIQQAASDSLRRLQTDYIDLYQSHDDDFNTPLEETLDSFTNLIREGKIHATGASNFNGPRLAEALDLSKRKGLARYESLQPLYNLYDRKQFETELRPICVENNLAVIPFYSLASGFLTGKYRDESDFSKSLRGRYMKKYFNDRGFRILHALDQIAGGYSSTPAAVALAWLMARPGVTAPIASITKIQQLDDLVRAINLPLDDASIELLNMAGEEDPQ